VLHCRQILEFLGVGQTGSSTIYIDSQSSIDLCTLLKMTHKTSSVNMRVNFVRECINAHYISLHFIPTHLNVADVLTKPLSPEAFDFHVAKLQEGFENADPADDTQQASVVVVDDIVETHTACECCYDMSALFHTLPHVEE
jgi:hypothetical protein